MIVLWFLCSLPLVLGEKNCCLIKRVLSGPLEGVYDLKGKRQEKEDCMDDCVYTRDVDGEDYCFSSVPNFPVECTDKGLFQCTNPPPAVNTPCELNNGRNLTNFYCRDKTGTPLCYPSRNAPSGQVTPLSDGEFVKCTNPNPPYPNNSPCKLPDGRTKNGTCCGIVSHKKMISANGICYPPGTQCLDNATNSGLQYLGSDLLWISCTVGWRECHIDEDVDGNKIVLGSTTYEKGLYAHANSSIQFSLDGKFNRFHSCIGIDKRSDCPPATRQGNARFRVIGDGDVLRGWQRKKGGEDAVCFQISVSGINVLRLETDDGGNTYECDHTAWADAYVYNKDYNGCYANINTPKLYHAETTTLSENSKAACQNYCISNHVGSNYFGLENGFTCRCGKDEPPPNSQSHPKVKDSRCKENQCPGDTKEWCGGTNYIRVFHIIVG